MSKRYFYLFGFVVLSLIAFNFLFKNKHNESAPLYFSISDCNVQQKKCKVNMNEHNLEVSMDKNIYYLKKFNINIFIENNDHFHVESINVSFNMKNMNMGSNRFNLKKAISENNKEYWKGTALLPICVTGRADWFSELEVVTKQNKYIIEFPILVKKAS